MGFLLITLAICLWFVGMLRLSAYNHNRWSRQALFEGLEALTYIAAGILLTCAGALQLLGKYT